MPAAIEYVPATDKERNSFVSDIRKERTARRTAYRTALKYYVGDHDIPFVVDPDEPNDNTRINLVKMTADRTISFLFPEIPRFVIDQSSVKDTPTEVYLKQVFENNGGLTNLYKIGLRSFLAGHGFVRVKPPAKGKKYPKLISLDPTSVSVFWKADDSTEVVWYEMRYYVGKVAYIKDFVNKGDHWMIYTYKVQPAQNTAEKIINMPTPSGEPPDWLDNLEFTGGNFVREGKVAKHTSEIPPIIDFAHLPHPDDYYGLSDFTEKDLQDTINTIASLRNRIVREHSEPVDVVAGADADEIHGEGSFVTIENAQAKVYRMEMKGNMSAVSEVLDKVIETYLAIARVVLLKGEAKDLQRVTNAAVRTLFLDAISKNVLLQASYGNALSLIAKLVLQMAYEAGHVKEHPDGLDITVKFGSALPTDMSEVANINALALNAGYMSLRQAATLLNLNWDEQQEAIEAETEWTKKINPEPEIQPPSMEKPDDLTK